MLDRSSSVSLLVGLSSLFSIGSALADPPDAGPADAGDKQPDGGEASSPAEQSPPAQAGIFEQGASSASSGAMSSSASAESPFKLNGYVRGDVFVGKTPKEGTGEIKASYGEAALVLRTKKESVGTGFAELRLRYGMLGEAQQQAAVDVREAYVDAYLGPLELRMGKQIIVWGRTDLLNPTSNITPTDFRMMRSPVEDDWRMGNTGVRANLRLNPVRFEGVWVPVYTPSNLPQVSLPKYVSFGDPMYEKFSDLSNSLLAGRIHLELPSFEMSVSYLRGFAPMTGITFDPYNDVQNVGEENPSVVIRRIAYRHQVVGFDFSTAVGELMGIRAEAAYRMPDKKHTDGNYYYIPRKDLQYALGIDHTFSYSSGSVMAIVQYLGRYTFDWAKSSPSQYTTDMLTDSQFKDIAKGAVMQALPFYNQILLSQAEKIQHLCTLRIDWQTLHETLSVSAIGMINVSTKEWAVAPKIGYRLSDNLVAYVGGMVFRGPTDSLFGLVKDTMSAGYAELRSTF
jgi:hypothetical protein